jgi:hypothetical protein
MDTKTEISNYNISSSFPKQKYKLNIINDTLDNNLDNNLHDNLDNNLDDNIDNNEIKQKKRSEVDFNCMELICALVLLNRNINNFNDLINFLTYINNNKTTYNHILKFNNETDFIKYEKDIYKKSKIIINYITNFKKCIETITSLCVDNIQTIYISGKKNKHLEIDILNNGLCPLEAKSDIYIKQKNNQFIGLSVKQSKVATKSNYSVQKILGEEINKTLTEIKKKYLTEQGFPKFNKLDREKVNPLFYPKNKTNPYMNKLKEEIENNKEMITKFLIEKLYSSNINYDVYEFNGIELTKLVQVSKLSVITFEEHLPYYYNTKGEERKAAKLFYRLTHNDKKYRVEVRWKGNIHNSSPQFQIHEE